VAVCQQHIYLAPSEVTGGVCPSFDLAKHIHAHSLVAVEVSVGVSFKYARHASSRSGNGPVPRSIYDLRVNGETRPVKGAEAAMTLTLTKLGNVQVSGRAGRVPATHKFKEAKGRQ
jgi:hypothetical protein